MPNPNQYGRSCIVVTDIMHVKHLASATWTFYMVWKIFIICILQTD